MESALPTLNIDSHPQRVSYTFGDITFDSNFDSGNIGRVEQVSELLVFR